jgi:hypothetical protein
MTTSTTVHPLRPRTSGGVRARRRRGDDPIDLLEVPARQLRLEVLLSAFRLGQPVDADALSCILLAKQSHLGDPLTLWTAESVRRLLWVDIMSLCTSLERRAPDRVAPTMWTLLSFLDSTNCLADGSDRLEQLREPLIDSGGVGPRGRAATSRRRHPASR